MKKYIFSALALVGVVVLLSLNPFTTIDAGERGVVLEFGAFNGKIIQPGINWVTPIMQDVVKMNVQTQALVSDGVAAYTKDGQIVGLQSTLNYNISPEHVGLLYRDIGLSYEHKIILPVMEETVKEIVAKYTAIEIPANREIIADVIEKGIRGRLEDRYIIVTDYIFRNEDFDDSYEAAIVAKQVAEQKAKEQENITRQEEEKKKQEILKAEALSEKTRLEAQALQFQGEAVIEKIKAEAQLEAAKKWDGKLPTHFVPGSTLPILNLAQ